MAHTFTLKNIDDMTGYHEHRFSALKINTFYFVSQPQCLALLESHVNPNPSLPYADRNIYATIDYVPWTPLALYLGEDVHGYKFLVGDRTGYWRKHWKDIGSFLKEYHSQ